MGEVLVDRLGGQPGFPGQGDGPGTGASGDGQKDPLVGGGEAPLGQERRFLRRQGGQGRGAVEAVDMLPPRTAISIQTARGAGRALPTS